MPGASELEENKIFKEIATGAGKGGDDRTNNHTTLRDGIEHIFGEKKILSGRKFHKVYK